LDNPRNRPQPDIEAIIARGRAVVEVESNALALLAAGLDDNFSSACAAILAMQRQLVVTGMGKSGHIARKIAATFSATGTPAIFLHPGEAGHGDLGVLAEGDVLLMLSNSGNTLELRDILSYATSRSIPVIGAASHKNSMVIENCDIPILLPRVREACSANIAPTASTAVQLALGDALAMVVMDLRGMTKAKLRSLHPAGAIGVSLAPVADLMHRNDRLPLVDLDTDMAETVSVMTQGCFGIAGVIDEDGRLAGIITDGDLRRKIGLLDSAVAGEVMTSSPKVIAPDMLAGDALAFLNENSITAAFVVEDPEAGPQPPLGIIHIHDLLRHGLN
jgi:arabinose-5-phosphate isomerase